jgi:uncharacterized repeat protein (TIGR03803 family)
MTKLNRMMKSCGIFLLWAAGAAALPAQTFTTLHSFDGLDGAYPDVLLIQGTDGNLHGTTEEGGANGDGTLFKITPSGALRTMYSFDETDGSGPTGLAQATDGNFYGTTSTGGAYHDGTVFKITPSGALTTLHSFHAGDGANPDTGLIQATDGNFYGTTFLGGANDEGTVFSITPSGTLTTLHSFDISDGQFPLGLVQGTDGNFYGATEYGGLLVNAYCVEGGPGCGTVFKVIPSGTLTTLYNFCSLSACADGEEPRVGLIQGAGGGFYGTTSVRGANNGGTVFKLMPSSTLTILYNFCSQTNCTDGADASGLVQGTDGNFYGTTLVGGESIYCPVASCGTIFKLTPSGTLTTLYNFCSLRGCADGQQPAAGLVQATDGTFYGTTFYGGANDDCAGGPACGTVFSLSVGLGPFVEAQPTYGKVRAPVKILGTDLTGATSVTFNGTTATFTVNSKSEITTTVPTGATTGTVQVVTPRSGTLSSNVPFTVLP